MNFKTVRDNIARHLVNSKGFKTNRKLIIIESDDWGSIRMPSKVVYEKMIGQGFKISKCSYARNDSLASEADLEKLFEVLLSFKDKKGNHPIITANCVTANPDFDKIQESDYKNYHWEPISETFKRYPNHDNCLKLWQDGQNNGLFFPQYHGREHVNWKYWLNELQNSESDFRKVFPCKTWVTNNSARIGKINPQAALDTESIEDFNHQEKYLKEGASLFEQLFGFKSKSYIATNFVIHSDLFPSLKECRIKYIQGMKYQVHPILKGEKKEKIRHHTGETNALGQTFLVRNCVFEPSQKPENHDNVGECLKDIENSFYWNRPAIITAHRLNFVGFIRPENRDRNLKMLADLLNQILKKWPDVEFMTSVQLGDVISG